jgi:ABC-type polysaccharide/polyol phosphate transport system ATPase subunit
VNPFFHLAVSYQEVLFFHGPFVEGHLRSLLYMGAASIALFLAGYWLFDRLRDSSPRSYDPSTLLRAGPAMNPAIVLDHVTKIYRRFGSRHFATLKSALLKRSILKDLNPSETFCALNDVSLRVPKGSTFGVIGRNGSGKSTALKLVAGITKPTSGTVAVNGRISALIELGAGFHPEISGRENVFINGIMLGLTKREIERRFDEIVEFAELAEFIDEPVKNYSSGMYMRLGFSVAVHVDPEVLLVDEVLAVGDEGFTHKCLDKFADFKRRGKTILLVTHSLGLVERFCDEAVWLDGGRKQTEGDSKRVIDAYLGQGPARRRATTGVGRRQGAARPRGHRDAAGGRSGGPDGQRRASRRRAAGDRASSRSRRSACSTSTAMPRTSFRPAISCACICVSGPVVR